MGLPDERKDSPNPPGGGHSGGSNELLYGWLVGRAAADLGLAQALAMNEAHHGAQLKRMEEDLLAQIHELKNSHSSSGDANGKPADLDALKLTIMQVSERQDQMASEQLKVEQLETAIRAKLGAFESQISQHAERFSSNELNDFKFELKVLADRVARAEFFAQQAQSPGETHQIEDLVAAWVKKETQAIKTQVQEELTHLSEDIIGRTVETFWQQKLDGLSSEKDRANQQIADLSALQQALDQLKERIDATESLPNPVEQLAEEHRCWGETINQRLGARIDELAEKLDKQLGDASPAAVEQRSLAAEMAAYADRIARLEETALRGARKFSAPDTDQEREAQHQEWARKIEELISARMTELWNHLDARVDLWEKSAVERERFQTEVSGLVNRLERIELGYQEAQSSASAEALQTAAELKSELAVLKRELKQDAAEASRALIQAAEETFNVRMNQFQSALVQAQENDQQREALFSELTREIQLLAGRLAHAETSTQQTHALMVNETAQTAQLRETVTRELTALQTQLAEWQDASARIDNLAEQFNGRIVEMQNQVSEKLALLAGRDAEIADLKMQMQNLIGMMAAKDTAQPSAPNRPYPPIGVTVGFRGIQSPPDGPPPAKPAPAASEPNSLLQSYDTEAAGSKDETRLQQRISADIERVRAELRKRAGIGR